MNAAASRDALLRALRRRPVIAETMDDGLNVLTKRLGDDMPRATVAATP